MKLRQIVWMWCGVWGLCVAALAQEPIYRCGNEYTNTVTQAQAKGCKLVEGGNLTVVQGARSKTDASNKSTSTGSSINSGARVDANAQKSRDSDAKLILQSELTKAEARHAELLKEYNNGAPEKQGNESLNYQKYLDRVAELKASLARNESDIEGIRRELGRASASTGH